MNLAQAIREGAAKGPQGFGALGNFDVTQGAQTCALGAAYEGIFKEFPPDNDESYHRLITQFPELTAVYCECPICQHRYELLVVIESLNDDHKWSREAIADFIDGMTLEVPACVKAVHVPQT